jgi:hypothetical protein
MSAANIRRHSTGFLFLQNPDDLLIAEHAAFHSSVSLRNRLYRKLAPFQGGASVTLARFSLWSHPIKSEATPLANPSNNV